MSITITETVNLNGTWAGTTPAAAGPAAYRLYAAPIDSGPGQYQFVDQQDNPGSGTVTWGTYNLSRMHVRPLQAFYLKVIPVTNKAIADKDASNLLADSPALKVTPAGVPGWSLGELLEQGVRPILVVGYDPTTKQCYPLNVVADGSNGYKLKV